MPRWAIQVLPFIAWNEWEWNSVRPFRLFLTLCFRYSCLRNVRILDVYIRRSISEEKSLRIQGAADARCFTIDSGRTGTWSTNQVIRQGNEKVEQEHGRQIKWYDRETKRLSPRQLLLLRSAWRRAKWWSRRTWPGYLGPRTSQRSVRQKRMRVDLSSIAFRHATSRHHAGSSWQVIPRNRVVPLLYRLHVGLFAMSCNMLGCDTMSSPQVTQSHTHCAS